MTKTLNITVLLGQSDKKLDLAVVTRQDIPPEGNPQYKVQVHGLNSNKDDILIMTIVELLHQW